MNNDDFNPMAPTEHLLVFDVVRREDASGTSGTGTVAKGVVFPSGTTVVEWQTHVRSVVVYSSYADALHIHGHKDLTGFVFQARPDRLYLASGEWVYLNKPKPKAKPYTSTNTGNISVEFYD